jgi:hypothetical protein
MKLIFDLANRVRADPSGLWAKAWVCGHILAGIAGSNTAGAWMPVSCECCVFSGREVSALG